MQKIALSVTFINSVRFAIFVRAVNQLAKLKTLLMTVKKTMLQKLQKSAIFVKFGIACTSEHKCNFHTKNKNFTKEKLTYRLDSNILFAVEMHCIPIVLLFLHMYTKYCGTVTLPNWLHQFYSQVSLATVDSSHSPAYRDNNQVSEISRNISLQVQKS